MSELVVVGVCFEFIFVFAGKTAQQGGKSRGRPGPLYPGVQDTVARATEDYCCVRAYLSATSQKGEFMKVFVTISCHQLLSFCCFYYFW